MTSDPAPKDPTSARPAPAVTRHEAGAERHRAPALLVVVLGLAAAVLVALVVDAAAAAQTLAAVLVGAALARTIGRGRRPEGVAVRATWVDVLILLALATGVALLSLGPGIR